jgi:uncharacterized protein YjbI with pentapeptide repeats
MLIKRILSFLSKYKLELFIVLIIATFLGLWRIPIYQVSQYQINNTTEQATLENQFRTTLAQMFGGVAVAIGIYFAWKNVKVAQATLAANQKNAQDNLKLAQDTFESSMKNAQENLKIAQEGQITERFTRAIDQLGNRKMEIRLGGIYALEKIADKSKEYCLPIMEILTAYVRKNSPTQNASGKIEDPNSSRWEYLDTKLKVPFDIESIMTIVGKRNYFLEAGESKGLELDESYLRLVNLKKAHLEGAYLYGTDFIGAHLEGAHLEGAHLERAYLNWAFLKEAKLERAHLIGTHLEWADLTGANFEGADLTDFDFDFGNVVEKAHLEGADLTKANLKRVDLTEANLERANLTRAHLEEACLIGTNLEWADLTGAHLEGADLTEAHVKGTNFTGADLEGANFTKVDLREDDDFLELENLVPNHNLTIDQLSRVKTLYGAQLDKELKKTLNEKHPELFKAAD